MASLPLESNAQLPGLLVATFNKESKKMYLTTNERGYRCLTTFSGSVSGKHIDVGVSHVRMSDDDILNRVMMFVNQHPHDEDENVHEAAMDLLDELLDG